MDYFIVNKPFGILSQFTREVPDHQTLADLYPFPKGVYPIGRLDKDSEGLLILSNDKKLNYLLLDPKHAHRRSYWVQVEGIPDRFSLEQLQKGVSIRVNKKTHITRPAKIEVFKTPPSIWERQPPIRFRANLPTTWMEMELTEGKNRQVRRMCAKVNLPVLRLVRYSIENLTLRGLALGKVRKMEQNEMYRLLEI